MQLVLKSGFHSNPAECDSRLFSRAKFLTNASDNEKLKGEIGSVMSTD
jgi:hypothetical protein